MKKCLQLLNVLIFIILSSGCAHFSSEMQGYNPTQMKIMQDRIAIAEDLFQKQNYQKALDYFNNFQEDFPHSPFDQQANLGRARSLTNLEKWNESLTILNSVSEIAVSEHDRRILALASFYSSLNYEALGDDPRTLACLMDAEGLQDYLPLEISRAELPARFAVYYNRHGNYDKAKSYFNKAEDGISVFFKKEKALPAKTYFQMGIVTTGETSRENLSLVLSTLELMQVFTLRSIEVEDPYWSNKALQSLKSNYRDIWNAILQIPRNSAFDPFASEQQQKESQFKVIGQMLEVLQRLRTFQRTKYEDNPLEVDLFKFLDELESHAQDMMESIAARSTLTPESQYRQKLKKEGVIKSEPFFPAEMEDPNLNRNTP
jgi:tetratricopeptide (TPR) repeat protein